VTLMSSGDVGSASKMNLVLQLIHGVMLSGLAEGMALADRANLEQKSVLEILNLTSLGCPLIREKVHGKEVQPSYSLPTKLFCSRAV
jgi:3-hydroxyisobutyrate dehydrogenase-like beta-hydroxyacid dehydrogenase